MSFAYWGLLLFTVVYFVRPSDWIPGLATIPLAKIVGALAMVGLVVAIAKKPNPVSHLPMEMVYVFLLFAQLCISVPFAIWRSGAFDVTSDFAKVVLVTLAILVTCNSLAGSGVCSASKPLRLWAWHCSPQWAMPAAIKSAIGPRLEGVVGGIFGNANDFALVLAMTFPFVFAFAIRSHKLAVEDRLGRGHALNRVDHHVHALSRRFVGAVWLPSEFRSGNSA